MSTTSVFVEILIIGLQAMVWVGLIVFAKGKHEYCLKMLEDYKEYAALMTTFLLAWTYVLGIFVDRVADCVYVLFQYCPPKKLPAGVAKMRLQIMHQSEGMAKFLDYQRSRLRIARATVFNLFVTLVVLFCIWPRFFNEDTNIAVQVIALMAVGLVMLLLTTQRIDKAQILRLAQAYNIVTGNKEIEDMSKSEQVVAAVCYKRINGTNEFLLVKTKGEKYWTFPKGKVKRDKDEPPWHAAHREACEEAGVSFSETIERTPFTSYKYCKGGEEEHDVEAFLMQVESKLGPCEKGRNPKWCTEEEAMNKLGKDRKDEYVKEYQRVLQEAVKLIG